MSVIRDYHILAAGTGRLDVQAVRRLLQAKGLEMVSFSTALTCGTCQGRGQIVRPDHRGCIVLPTDFLPCPEACDNGYPTDEARHAAIKAGDV